MQAIAFIDLSAHKIAEPFYDWCNQEPMAEDGVVYGWLEVARTRAYSRLNLNTMLDDIVMSVSPGQGIIVVGHGNDHSLLIPLAPKSTQSLNHNVVKTLNNYLRGVDKRPEKEIAKSMRFKDSIDMLILCDAIKAVRDLRLKHVALRACNLGASGVQYLQDLRELFNCMEISGPMVKDAYVDWDPNNFARSPEHFQSIIDDPKRGHMQVWGTTPNRVAFHTTQSSSQKKESKFSMTSLAESKSAIQEFLEEQFPTSKPFTYRPGQVVPIHAFYYKGVIVFPNSQYYAELLVNYPVYKPIPLPFYIPPDEASKPRKGLIARVRSNIQERRAARND